MSQLPSRHSTSTLLHFISSLSQEVACFALLVELTSLSFAMPLTAFKMTELARVSKSQPIAFSTCQFVITHTMSSPPLDLLPGPLAQLKGTFYVDCSQRFWYS